MRRSENASRGVSVYASAVVSSPNQARAFEACAQTRPGQIRSAASGTAPMPSQKLSSMRRHEAVSRPGLGGPWLGSRYLQLREALLPMVRGGTPWLHWYRAAPVMGTHAPGHSCRGVARGAAKLERSGRWRGAWRWWTRQYARCNRLRRAFWCGNTSSATTSYDTTATTTQNQWRR